MICSQCGREIPEGALFCCWCGARCAGKVCAVCGAGLRSDQLFCHVCGLRCDSGVLQTVEQSYGKVPVLTENSIPEEKKKPENESVVRKLTVSRKWQVLGTGKEAVVNVYINNKDLGTIGAGESLFTDIVSEKIIVDIRYSINELDVEISEMVDAQIMIPSYGVRSQKVGKRLILTNMDNPKMIFSLSDLAVFREGNEQYPKIETVVSGATILYQEQKLL